MKEYKYLGVNVHSQGVQENDINCRIEKANRLYYALNRKIFRKKEIRRETTGEIYNTLFDRFGPMAARDEF